MTTWLFDLGNTRLKLAPLADGAPGEVIYQPHVHGLTGLPGSVHGDVALLASVAPEAIRTDLLDVLCARFQRIHRVHTQARCAALRIAYAQPSRLGVDRFLSMLAIAGDARDTLLVGVGTALTIDLVAADGRHLGGRIAPSPTLMRESLAARSVALPARGGSYVEFADDTDDALASGCEGAAAALIDRSLQVATQALGSAPRLLLHGGGTDALLPLLPGAQRSGNLVLQGLAHWGHAMGIA